MRTEITVPVYVNMVEHYDLRVVVPMEKRAEVLEVLLQILKTPQAQQESGHTCPPSKINIINI